MSINRTKLVFISLILFITGCIEKDDFTHPVRIQLKIGIAPPEIYSRADYFYFNSVYIGVQGLGFEGKREEGGDIFFNPDPKMDFRKVEFNEKPEIISYFDIPQGVYNYMRWDVYLKSIETPGLIGIDSPNIGLVIWAIYEYLDESNISLFLCIDDTEFFDFLSYDSDLKSSIVLSENKVHEVVLFLDLYSAFLPISRESIEKAEISNDMLGKPIIIISSTKNKELFENLSYRISKSASACVY